MKKRFLSFLLLVCFSILTFIGLTGCDGENPELPTKLDAPVVTLNGNVALWEENLNADKFEISLNGKLSQVENTYTSETLTDGQSIKVRAIGDGIKYTTSDWSNTVTYTINVPTTPSHTCDFTGEWKKDSTHHWHECSCGETDTKVEHSGGTATETEKAVCTACGTAYGDYLQPGHTCDFTGNWKHDEIHHWHECECGETDTKVEHSGGTATTTEKAKCETCGQPYGELAEDDHEHSYSISKYDEEQHWFECECGDAAKHEKHHGGKATTTEKAKCETCGQPYGELAEDDHEHNYKDEYSYDETYHWHECECGDVIKKTEHSGGTATTTKRAVCLACGQEYGELAEEDPIITTAPTYIDITASNYEPDPEEVRENIQLMAFSRSISLEDALRAYLSDPANALGQDLPTASDYEIYSQGGNVVYIQIWLNNPDQNTILSLKLNGTKYQTGGALQSFFVEYGESYLNCVYVAITIPANSYEEITYEVTEIEYVEGSNISQDGKSVYIDKNNDTVTIGLPYEQSLPTATISNVVPTASTVAFDVNVVDEDNYVELVGGWLRVIIIDDNRTISGQEILKSGVTSVLFKNLSADSWYSILVFVLGDTHDGNGVYVHALASDYAHTESVITYESSSEILLDEETDKYYPKLTINVTLSETSFTLTKIEICNNYTEEVLYTSEFNGSIKITEGILCGYAYSVKVYYENGAGVEQIHYDYAFVDSLDYPYINSNTVYGLVDDGILEFEFGEGKYNLDNLKIQIYYEHSKEYIAEDALYLLENPTAIADLEALMETLDMRSEEYFNAYQRRNRLEEAQRLIDEYYSEVTELEWQQALEAGIYLYEFTYGIDEEFFKGANNKYYVILPDYQTKCADDSSWYYILTADIVEYGEINNTELSSGYFEINPAITEDDYLFVEYDSKQGRDLFYVDEENVLYLQTMSRNNLGDETHRALGYVNQVVLRTYDEFVKVLWTQEAADTTIDEEAWLEDMKEALIAGEDPHSTFPLGNLEPITFDLDDIDLSDVPAGNYNICYTYIMYGKEYTVDDPYDIDGNWLDYIVVGPLPQVSINIRTGATDDYGTFEIVIPESVNNGYWNCYEIEVRNADEELIGTYNQDNYGEIGTLSTNYSIRIKLTADEYVDYYTDGEWSEWFVCSAAKCDTPTYFSQYYTEAGITVIWDWVDGTDKYLYILNDGEEQETSENTLFDLKGGDTIKVKAVPATDSSYLESDYSEVYIVEDSRTPLATPVVSYNSDYQRLEWEAIENVYYYEVYDVTNDMVFTTVTKDYCELWSVGNTYIIKAIPSDYETYRPSQSEEISTVVKLTAPQIGILVGGSVYFYEYYFIDGIVTFTYIVNDGEEQTTTDPSSVTTLTVGDTIKAKASCDGYEDSNWSTAKYQIQLSAPELTISNYTATWKEVENAIKYAYIINDGEPVETTLLTVTGLSAGDTFKVSAIGDNENYLSSDYTDAQTVKDKLNAPVVTVDENGLASWTVEADAPDSILIFAIMINNNSYDIIWHYSIDETTYQLSLGDTIKVKLVDEANLLEESEWSNQGEYADTRIQIEAPEMQIVDGWLVFIAPTTGRICLKVTHLDDVLNPENYVVSCSEVGEVIQICEVSTGDGILVSILAQDRTVYDTETYKDGHPSYIVVE